MSEYIKYKGVIWRRQEGSFTARQSDIEDVDIKIKQGRDEGLREAIEEVKFCNGNKQTIRNAIVAIEALREKQ